MTARSTVTLATNFFQMANSSLSLGETANDTRTFDDEVPQQSRIFQQYIQNILVDFTVFLEVLQNYARVIGLFIYLVSNHLAHRNILVA